MNECSKYDTHCILFPIAIQSIEIYFLCIKNPVGALLQNYKKTPLCCSKENRVWIPPPQPVPITLCQEVPSFGWVEAGCFSAWGGQSVVQVGEASLHRCPEPYVQCEVVPVQGAGRSKLCSPSALSEAEAESSGRCCFRMLLS